MTISSIKDAVNALAQSLQASTIFPAGLFVFIHAFVFLPIFMPVDATSAVTISLVIACTLMCSYTLYAFNFPLIRFLEGYKLREDTIIQARLKRKQNEFQRVVSSIQKLREQQEIHWVMQALNPELTHSRSPTGDELNAWKALDNSLSYEEFRFDQNFPPYYNQVLPTSLGNSIAASEHYSYTRYGMDAVALWPRLLPLLKQHNYLEFVSQEKSVLDFLVNMIAVVAILGIEALYLSVFLGKNYVAIGILAFTLLMVKVLYEGSVVAARQWGGTVRVAFDLYRHELRNTLGLKPSQNFADEYTRWKKYSAFVLFRKNEDWFRGFQEFLSSAELDRVHKRNAELEDMSTDKNSSIISLSPAPINKPSAK